jgi:uncharacterized protein (TIGR02271 family)
MAQRYQFRTGADVYGSDGQKVGDISDVGPNYLHVTTGFLGLGGDLYIPFDAVSRTEDDKVYLNVPKDRVSAMGWTQKPAEAMEAGRPSTYAGTMPAATETAGGIRALPQRLTGYSLYSSDNHEIGKVYDQGPNYAHVRTGLFGLGGELYVPLSAIDHCTEDRCYLNVPADRISSLGWNRPPAEQAAAGYREEAAQRVHREAAEAAPHRLEEESRRIPLRDEEIEVRKHREKVGEVVIRKDVVEEQRTIDVPVTREEIKIERHTVDRPAEGPMPSPGHEEEVLRVPVYEDVVDVEKRQHVHEEVVVSPEDVTTHEHVTETIRREVPELETTGEARKFIHEEDKIEEKPEKERGEQRRRQAR